ncbi:hypothetical protein NC652_026785 [Populus alba x Populus x berolinensis]|nr:hypothetical protein NC652_026785 [Populus alba x Populus x berolinensis]
MFDPMCKIWGQGTSPIDSFKAFLHICPRQGQAEDCKRLIWHFCKIITLHSFEEDFSTAIARRFFLFIRRDSYKRFAHSNVPSLIKVLLTATLQLKNGERDMIPRFAAVLLLI